MTPLDLGLTTVVADDTVNMVEWWAAHGVDTPISGDDLARVKLKRVFEENPLAKQYYKSKLNAQIAAEL